MSTRAKAVALLLAAASASTSTARRALPEARVPHAGGLSQKKDPLSVEAAPVLPLLATLDQVHTGDRVALDSEWPTPERFDLLLADRVTGAKHGLDERLLMLLRALAAKHGGRIELVSGYRSPKLNEMLRKKGHHVSAHSQHSLGNACDFRVVPNAEEKAMDPRLVESEIRALGWNGGVGVYPTKDDWFVHADVGSRRSWVN